MGLGEELVAGSERARATVRTDGRRVGEARCAPLERKERAGFPAGRTHAGLGAAASGSVWARAGGRAGLSCLAGLYGGERGRGKRGGGGSWAGREDGRRGRNRRSASRTLLSELAPHHVDVARPSHRFRQSAFADGRS